MRNKKGMEWEFIIGIIILVVSIGLIMGIFSFAANKADRKTSENLCRGFNAIRALTDVDKGLLDFQVGPKSCKTINVKNIPTEDYDPKDGKDTARAKSTANREINDLIARCWWMWLEGRKPNMFDQGTLKSSLPDFIVKNRCFICYTFSLDNKVPSINSDEFLTSLNNPYFVVDTSSKCTTGGGGNCKTSCNADEKESTSSKCENADEKCCIDAKGNECVNKGGKCDDHPTNEFPVLYEGWNCRSGKCYVKADSYGSYFDYIQGTKGEGGLGFLLLSENFAGFNNKEYYAISLVSPGNDPNWFGDTGLFAAGTLAVTASYFFGTLRGVSYVLDKLVPVRPGGIYALYKFTQNSGTPQSNFIYVSKYQDVKNKCGAQLGVGQE